MARARSSKGQEIDPIAIVLFGIIFACYIIYQWIQSNWSTIVFAFEIIIAIVVICGILYAVYYIMTDKKRQQEKEDARKKTEETARLWRIQALETEQARRIDREEKLRKEAEFRATLFGQVIETIEKFQPTKVWGNEDSYHKELQGFLRAFFPNTKFELQTGASRPDIVIENIAIEIKGPTDGPALATLADKCMRYSHYYQNMIIVLFEPNFSNSRFDEFKKGMERHFPHVKIMVKR
jgi:hypothetical protein